MQNDIKNDYDMSKISKILFCEDSLEGIFTGIYDAYLYKYEHSKTYLSVNGSDTLSLFAETIYVEPNTEKSNKVINTINHTFGQYCYSMICKALSSSFNERGDAVYHMIVFGLKMSNKSNLSNSLQNKYVSMVFQFSRDTNNEILKMLGFLRFKELNSGILFSTISTKNNIITYLANHFSDRLPSEKFVIYDEKRDKFVIHPSGKKWILYKGLEVNKKLIIDYSYDEIEYQELFKHFFKSIAIESRRNIKLQTNMLPKRFQRYMDEFNLQ